MAENPPSGAVLDYVLKSGGRSPVVRSRSSTRRASSSAASRATTSRGRPTSRGSRRRRTGSPRPSRRRGAGHAPLRVGPAYETPEGARDAEAARGRRPLGAAGALHGPPDGSGGRSCSSRSWSRGTRGSPSSDADLVRQHDARARDPGRARAGRGALHQAEALRAQIAKRSTGAGAGRRGATLRRASGSPLSARTAAGPPVDRRILRRGARSGRRTCGGSPPAWRATAAVESADAAPTPDAEAALGPRRAEAGAGLARWSAFLEEILPSALNAALRAAGMPALTAE